MPTAANRTNGRPSNQSLTNRFDRRDRIEFEPSTLNQSLSDRFDRRDRIASASTPAIPVAKVEGSGTF